MSSGRGLLGAGLGAIGGFLFLGGFPGLIAGMSVGYTLFSPREATPAAPQELDVNNYNRLEVVPLLLGTDIVPSTVIWLNNFRTVNTDDQGKKKKVKPDDSDFALPPTLYLAELVFAFAQWGHINYPILNDIDLWYFLAFNAPLISDYTDIIFRDGTWPSKYRANPPISTAGVNHSFMYYDGPLGTDFAVSEVGTNMGGSPVIPQVVAEQGYDAPYYFWDSFNSNLIPDAIWYFLYWSGLNTNYTRFGANDGSNDEVYFINRHGAIGRCNIFTKTCTLIVGPGIVTNGWYNGINGNQYSFRTDNSTGRIYVSCCRNEYKTSAGGDERWYNTNGTRSNYTGYLTYMPTYSLEWDFFYIDIESNTATSIILNGRCVVPYNENNRTFPALYMNSMEFDDNYFYLFCSQVDPYYLDSWNWIRLRELVSYVGMLLDENPYNQYWYSNQHRLGKSIILKFDKNTGNFISSIFEGYFGVGRWVGYHCTWTCQQDSYCRGTSIRVNNDILFQFDYILEMTYGNFHGKITNGEVDYESENHIMGNGGIKYLGKVVVDNKIYVLYSNSIDGKMYLVKIGPSGSWDEKVEIVSRDYTRSYLTAQDNRCETYYIAPFNYNTQIYFQFLMNQFLVGPDDQLWRIDLKQRDMDEDKVLYIDRDYTAGEYLDIGSGHIGIWFNCKYLISDGNCTISTYVDTTPINAVSIVASEAQVQMIGQYYYQYPPNTLGYDPSDASYCLELITSKENGIEIHEPRFLYSNVFTSKIKGYDLLQDIAQTCRGYFTYCNGNVVFKIMKNSETPSFYFGIDEADFVSNVNSTSMDRIYIDLSIYPIDYWNGDIGTVIVDGVEHSFIIKDQTHTYILLFEGLTFHCPSGCSVNIIKDNIKSGSFNYSRKSQIDKGNRITVEFTNRFDDYREDTEEEENVLSIEENGLVQKTYSMRGIKRSAQAKRMATFLQDYEDFVNWMCGFETDLLGYMLCVGDIVGVTHPITGWRGKQFRIIKSSELQDFEVKLELEEYIYSIYHDWGTPSKKKSGGGGKKIGIPEQVERFTVIEDKYYNKLYFTFKEPTLYRSYWAGIRLYYYSNGAWKYFGQTSALSASVQLSTNITKDDRFIPITFSTLYLTFGSSGSFWIGDEEVYYNSMTTNGFYNCIRGYNGTVAADHLSGSLIIYKSDTIFSIDIPRDMLPDTIPVAGVSTNFMAVSFGMYGVPAIYANSPTFTLTIYGYGFLPLPVNSLKTVEVDTVFSVSPSVSPSVSASRSPSRSPSVSTSRSPSVSSSSSPSS
jgi:hypothetical protein